MGRFDEEHRLCTEHDKLILCVKRNHLSDGAIDKTAANILTQHYLGSYLQSKQRFYRHVVVIRQRERMARPIDGLKCIEVPRERIQMVVICPGGEASKCV